MPSIASPDAGLPIVDGRGLMTDQFQRWVELITRNDLLIGTGSPEGVVEATQGQEYMDRTGVAGAIKYIKKDADIAGDRTKGWVLI